MHVPACSMELYLMNNNHSSLTADPFASEVCRDVAITFYEQQTALLIKVLHATALHSLQVSGTATCFADLP